MKDKVVWWRGPMIKCLIAEKSSCSNVENLTKVSSLPHESPMCRFTLLNIFLIHPLQQLCCYWHFESRPFGLSDISEVKLKRHKSWIYANEKIRHHVMTSCHLAISQSVTLTPCHLFFQFLQNFANKYCG